MCEVAEVYEVEPRKARKEHICRDCRGTIKAGEIYRYHHGVFDGSGFSDKVCVECDEMRKEFNRDLPTDEQICVGQLYEAVFSTWDNLEKMQRFIATKIKRGCPILPWMAQRLEEAQAKSVAIQK